MSQVLAVVVRNATALVRGLLLTGFRRPCCRPAEPGRRFACLAGLACALAFGALAAAALAARNLPKDARFGKLTEFAHPYATISGKSLRLTPGAKIYNEQNLIIMPAAMRRQAKVLYRLDTSGSLSAIWILTEQEAAAYDRGSFNPKPAPKPEGSALPPAQAPAESRLGGRQ